MNPLISIQTLETGIGLDDVMYINIINNKHTRAGECKASIVHLSMVDWGMVGRCGMHNWSTINRSSVYNRSMVSRSSMDSSILRGTIILDISNITTIIISMVTDTLCTAIRKSNRVGSFNITISISRFSSIVVSTRVVIMHSILVSVGG